ncbi:MAG: DNA polymerase beta superfamily protein [bacterium]
MKIKDIKENIIFDCIVGSHAYGLNTPNSDVDYKGIFLLNNQNLLTLDNYIDQVSDDKNDKVYYELNRYAELLYKNNPNILELLYVPDDKIIKKSKIFDGFIKNRDNFLTKQCKHTFGGYSISQIKKAKGLNKKIVNPVDKERKTPIDFCYLAHNNGSINLRKWLNKQKDVKKRDQKYYGLQNINNMKNVYNLYFEESGIYKGITNEDESSNEIRLSSIPKGKTPVGVLYFNLEGYSTYCKKYKEYWEWVENRNEQRYNDNVNNSHNYDSKNLMHCVRLLDSAIHIGKYGTLKIEPDNKDFLFSIRYGQLPYEDIMKIVEDKKQEMDEVFDSTDLPDEVDKNLLNDLILEIRNNLKI